MVKGARNNIRDSVRIGTRPEYVIAIDAISKVPIPPRYFGEINMASGLSFMGKLPEEAKLWCTQYEELLRRFFVECRYFTRRILVNEELVSLNTVDKYSSHLIAGFLSAPSRQTFRELFRRLRRHTLRDEVITLIVCRNLGIAAHQVLPDDEAVAFYEADSRPRKQVRPIVSFAKRPNETAVRLVSADFGRPMTLCGQMSPYSSVTSCYLLGDKRITTGLLERHGYRVPPTVVVSSLDELERAYKSFGHLILKPPNGSNRKGVIGPIERPEVLPRCLVRCRRQSNGSFYLICQKYIDGTPYRINCNHGKVTFVARGFRGKVVGDGQSMVRQLRSRRLEKTDKRLWKRLWYSDEFVMNTLVGRGLELDSILPKGVPLELSQDGNEEGHFMDATTDFDEEQKKIILRISKDVDCPVIGVDVIVDFKDNMWIVDVNTDPGLTFFPSSDKAYYTMYHMLRYIRSAETSHRRVPGRRRGWS